MEKTTTSVTGNPQRSRSRRHPSSPASQGLNNTVSQERSKVLNASERSLTNTNDPKVTVPKADVTISATTDRLAHVQSTGTDPLTRAPQIALRWFINGDGPMNLDKRDKRDLNTVNCVMSPNMSSQSILIRLPTEILESSLGSLIEGEGSKIDGLQALVDVSQASERVRIASARTLVRALEYGDITPMDLMVPLARLLPSDASHVPFGVDGRILGMVDVLASKLPKDFSSMMSGITKTFEDPHATPSDVARVARLGAAIVDLPLQEFDLGGEDHFGNFLMHHASRRGQASVVKELLERGIVHRDTVMDSLDSMARGTSRGSDDPTYVGGVLRAVRPMIDNQSGDFDDKMWRLMRTASENGRVEMIDAAVRVMSMRGIDRGPDGHGNGYAAIERLRSEAVLRASGDLQGITVT